MKDAGVIFSHSPLFISHQVVNEHNIFILVNPRGRGGEYEKCYWNAEPSPYVHNPPPPPYLWDVEMISITPRGRG